MMDVKLADWTLDMTFRPSPPGPSAPWTDLPAPAPPRSRHPLDLEELERVDRDAILRELAVAPDVSDTLVAVVVRAFAAAALGSQGARTRSGWEAALRAVRVVLNGALEDGVREVRLAGFGIPDQPLITSWELIYAMVRAHIATRFREPGAATPEGRSGIKNEVVRLLWDALLDAIRQAPRPPARLRPMRPQAPS